METENAVETAVDTGNGGDELPSIDATMAATYEKIAKREREAEQQAGSQPQKPMQPIGRGPDGRFAAKQTEQGAGVQKPAAEQPVTAPTAKQPPQSWTQPAKERWATLPPEIQDEVLKRESDVERGFAKNAEVRQFGEEVARVVTPHMQMIQSEGGNALGAISDLLNTAALLRQGSPEQKRNAISEICKRFNIDMGGGYPQSQPEGEAYVDPDIAALRGEIAELKKFRDMSTQERQAKAWANAGEAITSFKADKTNTHFEAVKDTMAQLLSSGMASDLKGAYELACRMNPEISRSVIEAELKANEQKRLEEEAKKAEGAKKAAVANIKPRGGVPQGKPAAGDWEQTMRRRYKELNA